MFVASAVAHYLALEIDVIFLALPHCNATVGRSKKEKILKIIHWSLPNMMCAVRWSIRHSAAAPYGDVNRIHNYMEGLTFAV
jgi:hypothetical protein